MGAYLEIGLAELHVRIILAYLALINAAALAMFGMDKSRARRGSGRISEASLFMVSLMGGVWGGLLGMLLFRHKTGKAGFKAVMLVIMIVNIAALYFLVSKYGLLSHLGF